MFRWPNRQALLASSKYEVKLRLGESTSRGVQRDLVAMDRQCLDGACYGELHRLRNELDVVRSFFGGPKSVLRRSSYYDERRWLVVTVAGAGDDGSDEEVCANADFVASALGVVKSMNELIVPCCPQQALTQWSHPITKIHIAQNSLLPSRSVD